MEGQWRALGWGKVSIVGCCFSTKLYLQQVAILISFPQHMSHSEAGWMNTLTALWVCVCPTRINMFEQIMDRQKLMRMIDRSERIYLRRGGGKHTKRLTCFIHSLLLCFRLISHTRNITNSGHEWTYGLKCLTLSDSEYISHYVAKVSLLLASV